jgi:hypothetical protein
MTENSSVRIIGFIRIIVVLFLIGVAGLYSFEYILTGTVNDLFFLLASIAFVGMALLNLLVAHKRSDIVEFQYALFLFAGIAFILVGNLVMAGMFYITPDAFYNSIFFVGTGLVFYLFSLRTLSPLLLRSPEEGPRLLVRNLLFVIICVSGVVGLYYFTAFNPYGGVLSYAVMLYAMILATTLAFALTKSFEVFPILFKVVLVIGLLSFLFSSWVLAVIEIASSDFLSRFVVGVAFIVGQFLIHLSPIFQEKSEQ